MELIADALLGAGALGAAIYCIVLSRRLKRFNNLQNGMGGAVAVLSAQVDDMTKALENARNSAEASAEQLTDLTKRAEAASRNLELMMASLHDLPEEPTSQPSVQSEAKAEPVLDTPKSDVPMFLSHRHSHLEAAE